MSSSSLRRMWTHPPAHSGWFRHLISARQLHGLSSSLSPCMYHSYPSRTHVSRSLHATPPSRISTLASPSSLPPPLLLRSFSSKRLKTVHAKREERRQRAATPSTFNPYRFRLGIFGRPNVGKSTLFNRLAGRRLALVDATPGVTRDRREADGSLAGLEFTIIDTAGLDEIQSFLHSPPSSSQLVNRQPPSSALQSSILQQTRLALASCDIALFLIDARQAITEEDRRYARMIRDAHMREKERLPVLLIANKAEEGTEREMLEGLEGVRGLGLGEPIEISAEHGEGLAMLHNAIDRAMQQLMRRKEEERKMREAEDASEGGEVRERLPFAIVGRPNTGKSTLLNALLGEERVVTGPQAGITRDAISTRLPRDSHARYVFEVVDTAGIRGGRITRETYSKVDGEAMTASLKAIDMASIVVLCIDATEGEQTGRGGGRVERKKSDDTDAVLLSRVQGIVHAQDLTIAKRVTDEGRALIIVINKIDAIEKEERADVMRGLRLFFDSSLPQVKTVPLIPLSALTALHLPTLLPAVVHTYERWDARIPTAKLNAFLHALQQYRPHPSYKGKRIRLKFMAQTSSRPPSFAVWVGGGGREGLMEGLSDEWLKMMKGMLVKEFGLEGIPVRLRVKKGEVKDREERRAAARRRDDAQADIEEEGEHPVRTSELQVEDDEEYGEEDEDDGMLVAEEADVEEEPHSPRARGRPAFIPFEEDEERQLAVRQPMFAEPIHSSSPSSSSPRSDSLSNGFMSPAPLVPPTPSSLSRRFPRPSRSHLSFLPLPLPSAPSASLPWSSRVELQQTKQKRRSEAIKKKKELRGFVSEAAWRNWKSREEERHKRWVRRDNKIKRGREKKAGRGVEEEVREVHKWGEGRGEKKQRATAGTRKREEWEE